MKRLRFQIAQAFGTAQLHRRRIAKGTLTAALTAALLLSPFLSALPADAAAISPPLGTAANFGAVAATTVTNTGPTVVTGDIGVSPGTAVVGFPPGIVNGTIHAADGPASAAAADVLTAYNFAAGEPCDFTLSNPDLGGMTLLPGVYCFTSVSVGLTGTLTLNAGGNPTPVWLFKIGSTLITASNSAVVLIGTATPCNNNNITWQVGSSATLGTGTSFMGNILAKASITLNTSATSTGSLYAHTGAVTMDTNMVYTCAGAAGKFSPTISTQASAGNLLGAPVHDTARMSGGSRPTGSVRFRLFSDASCATQVFTSTIPLGGGTATSDNFTPTAVGTYYWTASYSGDGNNYPATSPCGARDESVVIRPFVPPPCTSTLTGDVLGPVTVNSGQSVCITNARVVGPVTVNPGGALTVVASQISRGIVADGPSFFSVCGSQVSGPSTEPGRGIVVSNATVPLRIGDPAAGCAFNRVAGDVILSGNTAGLTLGSNIVSGNVTVNNNTVGTEVIKANNVFGALACSGNNPPPTNAGQPNTAGSKSGQCTAL